MANFSVKNIFRLLQFLALVLLPITASPQSKAERKEIFLQAESYYLFEEYELANQLYLLLETPDNGNIKYKIGVCYLNIPGEKQKAIAYLEEAVKTCVYNSKTDSHKEKQAPLDAWFYLAKAYMVNNDIDKGFTTLVQFSKLAEETKAKGGMKNIGFTDQQLQACKNALAFRDSLVLFSKKTMGSNFSQGAINDFPAVSFDGNSIVYTETRGTVNAIFYSRKERGRWQVPVEITQELKAGEDCSSCSLNNDGTELFLYKTDNYDGAIYSSNLENGKWTPIKKLNRNINTKYYESHAAISRDGNKLYFTSNREEGVFYGGLDIFVSEKDATGDWGPAVNLGNKINTAYNEDTPFITSNDSILYFCSEGHNSMGGFDLYRSLRDGTGWSVPDNLGFPLNSPDDDKFFQPANNGANAFYSFTTDYKKKDIFYLTMGVTDIDQVYEINGHYSLNDTILAFDENYKIRILNTATGDTLETSYPEQKNGYYNFTVKAGDYRLIYSGVGYFTQIIDTTVVETDIAADISLDVVLKRDLSAKRPPKPQAYERIILADIPKVDQIDSAILIRNLNVNDVSDTSILDSEILYYTVQVMALYNPVDPSYFKYINDLKIMYNEDDKFYRYTTGTFESKEKAYEWRFELIRRGYLDDLFIKIVSR
ncbi:MAG: hypothetical protein MUE32_02160 [Bacteroidales bacterium]|jgi:hypothetical protein|nr:hypothetical protein [Bacteroidales bacterium]